LAHLEGGKQLSPFLFLLAGPIIQERLPESSIRERLGNHRPDDEMLE
jgi:hypothetical protein